MSGADLNFLIGWTDRPHERRCVNFRDSWDLLLLEVFTKDAAATVIVSDADYDYVHHPGPANPLAAA